mmetsp:Transcript_7801/g.12396  ORF Transcript_7801/g.12396 Transcript_7801/m.12396 type:complete len:85 (-) Transcript_7801:230-484(-)
MRKLLMVFAVVPAFIGAIGVLVAASVLGYSVVNLNNTTLLGDAAMDQNAEPKALGNDRAQARANQEIETAAAQDAAFTAKQHYI